jgi:hypothetical protein
MDFRLKQPRFDGRIDFNQRGGLLRPYAEDSHASQARLMPNGNSPAMAMYPCAVISLTKAGCVYLEGARQSR